MVGKAPTESQPEDECPLTNGLHAIDGKITAETMKVQVKCQQAELLRAL
jgi:hypothetical protein